MTVNWGLVQLGVFLSLFAGLLVVERIWPRRTMSIERVTRWSANMGFIIVNTGTGVVVRLLVPTLMAVEAVYVQGHGLLPALGVNVWIAGIISVAALDLSLYVLHVATHRIPLFWRFHRVHHVDLEVDATTALRAHPAEFVASLMCKGAVIFVLGAPVMAVLAYEIILNFFAMFTHSNIRLGDEADLALRRVIVTPDMHRIHHSTIQTETDSNYGVVTPLWDRLFGTYTKAPRDPQTTMKLGLDEVRGLEAANLFWLMAYPFMGQRSVAPEVPSVNASTTRSTVTTSLRTPA